MSAFSVEELATRTGEPAERIRSWLAVGLIGSDGSESFSLEDVARVQMFQFVLSRGISEDALDHVAGRLRELLDRFLEWLKPPEKTYTVDEASEALGFDTEQLRPYWNAVGLSDPFEEVGDDDLAVLGGLRFALTTGLPEEALLQLARVYGDALRRVAEAETRLFHIYVHERLRMEGVAGEQLHDSVSATGDRVQGLIEPMILYFHKRAFARAVREDLMLHVAEELGLRDNVSTLGEITAAVAFIDLSSFTPLTAVMGDEKAAEVIDRFSQLVRDCIRDHAGRIVKQIGDGFMLLFPDAPSAVAASLAICDAVSQEPQFPAARAGIHFGPMLYREGDYVGAVVNAASRLADRADRHQILVSSSVRREAAALPVAEFIPLGRTSLKGVAEDLELFEVRRMGHTPREKSVDPVCGMELRPAEAAARLAVAGSEQIFCSNECLRRFVADPDRYLARGAV